MKANIERMKRQWKILSKIFNIMGLKYWHIALPLVLSIITVFFGGISLGLLVPLARGVTSGDYSFLNSIPVLKHITAIFDLDTFKFLTPNRSMFLMLAILIFVSTLLKLLIDYGSNAFVNYWNKIFDNRASKFVFNRFLSFGKLYFDRVSQGYVNKVMEYSRNVLGLVGLAHSVVREILDILVHFAIMVFISWKLTLYSIMLFPILHFLIRNIAEKISELAVRNTEAEIGVSKSVFNILSCMPLIKIYSKEETMNRTYGEHLERLRRIRFKSDIFNSMVGPLSQIVILGALLSMVAFVALIVARDKAANLASFLAFFYIARNVIPKFGIFNNTRIALGKLKPPIKEVVKVLQDDDKVFVDEGSRQFEGLKTSITVKHLNFSYIGERQVLRDISLTIEKGKMTALVGPTGAGKTTIANVVMRLYNYSSGSIKIDGVDIREFQIKSIRSHISMVPQDTFLLNDSLRNNIAFGLDADPGEKRIMDVVKKARLHDFIMSLPEKLDTEIGDRGIRLSGGEKQRVSIARALLRNTEILILDEATSSLDTHTERLIQQSIEEATKDKTTIVIAHRLSTIRNAGKIIVIEDGKIAEEGPLKEILAKKGKFYRYWEEQKFY